MVMVRQPAREHRVTIVDTTLCVGALGDDWYPSVPEAVEIARQLTILGVDAIEAGSPAGFPSGGSTARAVARYFHEGGPTISVLAGAKADEIDRAWEAVKRAARGRIHVFADHPEDGHAGRLVGDVRAAVARAKGYIDDVEFSPTAGGPAELVCELAGAARDEGATTVSLPDGAHELTLPDDVAERMTRLYEALPELRTSVLGIDCHNNRRMAVPNSLAGIENGCRQVRCAMHGKGGRAGNAALEVMAITLYRHPTLGTEINMREIVATSDLVCQIKGYELPANQPVVGRNVLMPKPMRLVEDQYARVDSDRALLETLGQPIPAWMDEWPSQSAPEDPVS
jgi:2-isopropylmalate synthase